MENTDILSLLEAAKQSPPFMSEQTEPHTPKLLPGPIPVNRSVLTRVYVSECVCMWAPGTQVCLLIVPQLRCGPLIKAVHQDGNQGQFSKRIASWAHCQVCPQGCGDSGCSQ